MKILLKDPNLVSIVLLEITREHPPYDHPLSEIISDIKEEMKNGDQILLEVEYRMSGVHGGSVSDIWYYKISDIPTDQAFLDEHNLQYPTKCKHYKCTLSVCDIGTPNAQYIEYHPCLLEENLRFCSHFTSKAD